MAGRGTEEMIQPDGTIIREIAGPEAAELLKQAEDVNSAYHGCFIWDDATAARLWRLQEAQSLLDAWKESEDSGKDGV